MARRKRPVSFWIALGVGAGLLFLAGVIYGVREDILRAQLDPKQPFQTYTPPPAPDYAKRSAWALLPADPAHPAATDLPVDVFFVHPTTFDGGRDWLGPIGQPTADHFLFRVVLPNYAGPFERVGRMFAPRYRQASLYAHLTLREDAREARAFAYGDVRDAFRYYLEHFNQGRPFIVVGVEQGGLLGDRLLREEVARNPDLVRRLAAAYLIDTVTPRAPYQSGPVTACVRRDEAHCVVGWMAVPESDPNRAKMLLSRAVGWTANDRLDTIDEAPALCVNPLLGAQTDAKAPAKLNLGAANATELEWGARPAFLPRQVSAQCVGGLLRVSHPRSGSLQPAGNWPDKYKAPGNNLFFADLEADAMKRVATYYGRAEFPTMAAPIEKTTVVRSSAVHRID